MCSPASVKDLPKTVEIDPEGFRLHSLYAYPAFASLPKYKKEQSQILNYINGSADAHALLKFYAQSCPYMIIYVKPPFRTAAVRQYWCGTDRTSHNAVKFSDWIVDDMLKMVELKYSAPTDRMRSVRCDINELNRCIVIPTRIRSINGPNAIVEYKEYQMVDGRLALEPRMSTIDVHFIPDVAEGDVVTKHFSCGIEKVKECGIDRLRYSLIDAFNSHDTGSLAKLLPVSDKIIDLLR